MPHPLRAARRIHLCVASALVAALIGTFTTAHLHAAPQIIFVQPGATCSVPDGTQWSCAYPTLATALTNANIGSEIWVAQGRYTPGNSTSSSFRLKSGVAVYGGFVGTETQRDQRDWLTHATILSGDIDGNDAAGQTVAAIRGGNSAHIVSSTGVDATAVLDGFTITGGTGGAATGAGWPDGAAGGIFNSNGSPTFRHLIVRGNTALIGAGVLNDTSQSQFSDVTLFGNRATTQDWLGGGGMTNYESNVTLSHMLFEGNSAYLGGGLRNVRSNARLTDVIFRHNTATVPGYGRGAGIANNGSNPVLVNVQFLGNVAAKEGGGLSNGNRSQPILVNVIFSGNRAQTNGGAIYTTETSTATLQLVTFSGNSAGGAGGAVYAEPGSSTKIYNSIVWGNTGTQIVGSGCGHRCDDYSGRSAGAYRRPALHPRAKSWHRQHVGHQRRRLRCPHCWHRFAGHRCWKFTLAPTR